MVRRRAATAFPTDPAGNPLSPHHPWNKITKPRPQGQNWKEKYTWDTAPRWDRHVDGGRRLRAAVEHRRRAEAARRIPSSNRPGTPSSSAAARARCPRWSSNGTFRRSGTRSSATARAPTASPFTALVAINNWLAAMERLKLGDTRTSTPFEIPKQGEQLGVGFWGAGRGYLTHHLVLDRGAVANYQIVTPSTWNASPTDRWGQPGPYEEAVLNTPLLEETDDPTAVQGHRRPARHPELRPVHAVHDAHPLGRRRHHARGEHLRVRSGDD